MVTIGLVAFLALAAAPLTASLGVGATVVRPEPVPRPAIAIARGAIIVRDSGHARVSAEGGTPTRGADGAIRIAARGTGIVRITLTY